MFKKLQQQLAAKREAGKAGPFSGKQLSVGSRVVKVDRLLGEGEGRGGWRHGLGKPSLPLPPVRCTAGVPACSPAGLSTNA
jgi:hypothetical protein